MRGGVVAGAALAVTMLAGCASSAPTAAVGDCLNVAINETTVTELARVSCEQEHDVEVYFVGASKLEAHDGVALNDEAQQLCLREFWDFVGVLYPESVLDIYYLYPEENAWEQGDREIICGVYEPDAATGQAIRQTGSLEGSER